MLVTFCFIIMSTTLYNVVISRCHPCVGDFILQPLHFNHMLKVQGTMQTSVLLEVKPYFMNVLCWVRRLNFSLRSFLLSLGAVISSCCKLYSTLLMLPLGGSSTPVIFVAVVFAWTLPRWFLWLMSTASIMWWWKSHSIWILCGGEIGQFWAILFFSSLCHFNRVLMATRFVHQKEFYDVHFLAKNIWLQMEARNSQIICKVNVCKSSQTEVHR